jgi:Protein of unknown function (DUF1559)
MVMAMHNYQAEHGRLPSAVVYGKDGKPLHSWRVLLLPYIAQEELYKEFNLDEPWDSPHNLQLLPRMPATYAPPPGKAWRVPAHHTVCQVFVGEGAAFEGREGLRMPNDFPDGPSSTFLVVEAGDPVPWTKPADLRYDADGPLPNLRCLFKDGFRACLADGSRRWVSKGTSEADLRAAITRNGKDTFGPDW